VKPYYQDDAVTIYHGDCMDVMRDMPAGAVACVVTSPPYNTLPALHKPSGIHAERKSGVNKWIAKAAKGYFDTRPEGEYQAWLREVVGECLRVCSGLVWVNHKIRYRDGEALHPVRFLPFPIYAEVVWDRRGSMALNCKRYAPSHENLWAFGRPTWWCDDLNTRLSVWQIPFDTGNDEHPCAFPMAIASRPIVSSCPPGATVLDPFAGSGTTGRAAKDLGRKAVLIEREERYCEIAASRMAQGVLPLCTANSFVDHTTTDSDTTLLEEP
jgi:site-specific DNA-methyltransferase (adenine-specific)